MAVNALSGLDSLELGESRAAGSRRLARRALTATWPKLLAIAIVYGLWQLFYLSNWHGDTASGLIKAPNVALSYLWDQLHHAQLWQAIGATMQTAVTGYLLALAIGSAIGALVSRIPPL